MASFWPTLSLTATLLIFTTITTTTLFQQSSSSKQDSHSATIKLSTISAAPAVLPGPPLSDVPSPALSPDIYPEFPTPAKNRPASSPAESSLPTIPSSPSPPNPDASSSAASGPTGAAFAPEGSSLRETSSSASFGLSGVTFVSLVVAFCVMWIN